MPHPSSRLALVGALVTVAVAGCASVAGTTAGDPQSAASSAGTTNPSPPTQSASATPSAEVDWNSGGGQAEMSKGLPSPSGWYPAAFGSQDPTVTASATSGGPGTAEPSGGEKVLYLTFDDGPSKDTPELLDLLAAAGAKATFFVIGQQAAEQPEMLRKIASDGHAIGNHTWNHPELTKLSAEEVSNQLTRTTAAVDAATPIGACMRPPYGLINDEVAGIALSQHLQPILWTAHAEDWNQPPVDAMVADLRAGTAPGAVFLLHDGGGSRANTLAAVKQMLPEWRSQGYRLASVPACTKPAQ